MIYYQRSVTSDLLSAFSYKRFIFDIQNARVVTLFIIGNFDIFALISLSDIASINLSHFDIGNYRSVWHHIMTFNTNINSNIHFEGLYIHYH